jgi:hypothetical protein
MFRVTVRGGELPQEEINQYIFYTKKRFGTIMPDDLEIIIELDGDHVNLIYDPPFTFRAYRGTDYLVNDAEKLNASKFAELCEKIPNSIE